MTFSSACRAAQTGRSRGTLLALDWVGWLGASPADGPVSGKAKCRLGEHEGRNRKERERAGRVRGCVHCVRTVWLVWWTYLPSLFLRRPESNTTFHQFYQAIKEIFSAATGPTFIGGQRIFVLCVVALENCCDVSSVCLVCAGPSGNFFQNDLW